MRIIDSGAARFRRLKEFHASFTHLSIQQDADLCPLQWESFHSRVSHIFTTAIDMFVIVLSCGLSRYEFNTVFRRSEKGNYVILKNILSRDDTSSIVNKHNCDYFQWLWWNKVLFSLLCYLSIFSMYLNVTFVDFWSSTYKANIYSNITTFLRYKSLIQSHRWSGTLVATLVPLCEDKLVLVIWRTSAPLTSLNRSTLNRFLCSLVDLYWFASGRQHNINTTLCLMPFLDW